MAALGKGDAFTNILTDHICTGARELPLALVMITQLQLDMVDVIGTEDLSSGSTTYGELHNFVRYFKATIGPFEERFAKVPHFSQLVDSPLSTPLRDHMAWCIKKGLETPPEGVAGKGWSHCGTLSMSPMLRLFPALSAHAHWNLEQSMHEDGIACCNMDTAMLAVMHLYKACRKSGLLKKDFPDLAFAISLQGEKTVGLVDPGVNARPMLHAAKYFGMALGIEPKEYLSRARAQNATEQGSKVRLPPLRTILKRMRKLKVTSGLVAAQGRCADVNRKLQFSTFGVMRTAMYSFAQESVSAPGSNVDEGIRQHWLTSHKLSPIEALTVVRSTLGDENLGIHFSYHDLLLCCYDVIAHIKQELNSTTYSGMLSTKTPNGRELLPHELINHVLWHAAEAEERRYHSPLLALCASIFEDVIAHTKTGGERRWRAEKWAQGFLSYDRHQDWIAYQKATNPDFGTTTAHEGLSVDLVGSKLELKSPMLTNEETEARRAMLQKTYTYGIDAVIEERASCGVPSEVIEETMEDFSAWCVKEGRVRPPLR